MLDQFEHVLPVHGSAWFAGLGELYFACAVGRLSDDDGAALGDVEVLPVEAVGFADLAVHV